MTRARKELLSILKDIHSLVVINELVGTTGICPLVTNRIGTAYGHTYGGSNHTREIIAKLSNLIRQWPEYSGEYAYPVKGVEGMSAKATYWEANKSAGMWKGEYGESRMRLLIFLIAELEKLNGIEETNLLPSNA